MALLTIMKGQPLAYNRDNQEDKENLFDAVDTVKMSLLAYAGLIPSIVVNSEAMYHAASSGYATATDLADYLVVNGLAFRDAHEAVGQIVQFAIKENRTLAELTLPELQEFSAIIKEDVYSVLELEGSVASRNHIGGTAPQQVRKSIDRLKQQLND